ncbi:hypothetical protein BH708_03080 [Brachybacterium sp. P6-10-X1]|uniref:DUF7455 domain-containing protein n=1 Tax=Brachybacterium sp. P6-10-X1 TaxID=1903186 RepID=UPI00097179D1|nr:hypothetical protein [Brachybacterium sp. P6-10-X1]APX31872.1 hypothetical protein BH708_03080 [Brachybacterium sp. P6-10-X1]
MSTTIQSRVPAATPLSVPPRRADTLFGPSPTVASELQPCDRCPSAAAKIRADFATGPVYRCGHHARGGWGVLERTALRIRADVPTGSFYLPMAPR